MIDHGLRTLLLAQSSITTLVPAQTIKRVSVPSIFCDSPVQGAVPPFVVITIISGDPYLTLESTYHGGLMQSEIDIDCFHQSAETVATIEKTIRQYLDDYTGAAGASDTIAAVLHDRPIPGYDFPGEGFDVKYHYLTTTYQIQYTQS